MKLISRRKFMHGSAGAAAITMANPAAQVFAEQKAAMDAMTAILTRRSVCAYTEAPVSPEHIEAL